MNLIAAFILTFIIELAIVFAFLRKNYFETSFYILLINLFSWPLANLVYGFWNHLAVIEFGVFLVEGILILILFRLNWKKAFLISFVANFVSAFVSILLD